MNAMGEPGKLFVTQREMSMDTLDTHKRERELSMDIHARTKL